MVAGVGFFTDVYDIFAVNFANMMIGFAYSSAGMLSPSADTAIKISTSAGTVIGQFFIGIIADKCGCKSVYGIELIIIIIATIGICISNGGHAVNFVGVLIFWRILLELA